MIFDFSGFDKKNIFAIAAAFISLNTPAFGIQEQKEAKSGQTLDNRAQIEAIIEDYIENNPEVIFRALLAFQNQQSNVQMLQKINVYRDYLESGKDYPFMGNPNGKITLVEFFDYRCGFCKRNFSAVMKIIEDNPDLKFVPRQFPILDKRGEKPLSRILAKAALASHKQGKFTQFHTALMTSSGSLTEDKMYRIAQNIGLNIIILKADMQDDKIETTLSNTLNVGQEIGFSGTPAYFVGNQIENGAVGYVRLQEAVNKAREQQKSISSR